MALARRLHLCVADDEDYAAAWFNHHAYLRTSVVRCRGEERTRGDGQWDGAVLPPILRLLPGPEGYPMVWTGVRLTCPGRGILCLAELIRAKHRIVTYLVRRSLAG